MARLFPYADSHSIYHKYTPVYRWYVNKYYFRVYKLMGHRTPKLELLTSPVVMHQAYTCMHRLTCNLC